MTRRKSLSEHLSAVGLLLVLAHLASGLLLALLLKLVGEERSTVLELAVFYGWFGGVFAQVACLSFWFALGRGSVAGRLIVSAFACCCLWWLHFMLIAKSVLPLTDPKSPGLALLAQWVLLSATFWFWRFLGWEIRHEGVPDPARTASHSQFGVRHLLVLTTLVALISATGKSLERSGGHWGEIAELLLFVLVNGLFTWTLFFVCLRGDRPWRGLFIAITWVMAMTVLETFILRTMMQNGIPPKNLGVRIFLANSTQVAFIATTAAILRLAGYRLLRRTSS